MPAGGQNVRSENNKTTHPASEDTASRPLHSLAQRDALEVDRDGGAELLQHPQRLVQRQVVVTWVAAITCAKSVESTTFRYSIRPFK